VQIPRDRQRRQLDRGGARRHELEEMIGLFEAAQCERARVDEPDAGREAIGDERRRRGRHDDLVAAGDCQEAGSPIHRWSEVVAGALDRFSGVEAHADLQRRTSRPRQLHQPLAGRQTVSTAALASWNATQKPSPPVANT
jgi:hypothetical protein